MNPEAKDLSYASNLCEICQKAAERRCGQCHMVYYCSKHHQREHWKQHKNSCRPFKVLNEDNKFYLVATRSINLGEIILQEKPIIWGPSLQSVPVCLGCAKKIDEKNSKACFKCGWPMCGDLCEKSPCHIPECRYTVQRGERVSIKKFGVPHPIYRCVLILRCLYHKQFLSRSWKKLEKLEKFSEIRSTLQVEKEQELLAVFIRRFFKLFSIFSIEDVKTICGLIMINSHQVTLTNPPFSAIYDTSSWIEHNCSANCTKSFTDSGDILITAATPIKEGDHINLSVVNALWGTPYRRDFLHKEKFFWCQCHRCQDPTEFNTNISAIKCRNNCSGFLLPESFIDNQKMCQWICNKCTRSLSSYSVHDILERISTDLSSLDKTNVEECKKFFEIYGNYLHGDHFYFNVVKYEMCQILGKHDIGLLNDEDLKLKLQCCENLEELIRRVCPAEKCILGRVLFEKFTAVQEIGKRLKIEHLQTLNEPRIILLEVIELLKFESKASSEGQLYLKAVEILKGVNDEKT